MSSLAKKSSHDLRIAAVPIKRGTPARVSVALEAEATFRDSRLDRKHASTALTNKQLQSAQRRAADMSAHARTSTTTTSTTTP